VSEGGECGGVKRLALCLSLLMVAATAALAANWIQIPGVYQSGELAYVDIESVRQDRILTQKAHMRLT
jgi:hypothetical protein